MKQDKAKVLSRLTRALKEIDVLRTKRYDCPEFEKWYRDTEVAIEHSFGDKSRHVADFRHISYSPTIVSMYANNDNAYQRSYLSGLQSAQSTLQSMIEEVTEYWEDGTPQEVAGKNKRARLQIKNVFVVHGHDNETKETVARFLSTIGLQPIILHEQPNQGRTIIEKFEDYSDAAFAVILLTPDDIGGPRTTKDAQQSRARQNVVFEFGYFLGSLGRANVCALTRGQIELPSDYSGVLYLPLDPDGAWKFKLVKELKAAGLEVDANAAF